MSLKLNNQLAHLPNEVQITRFEKHQDCLELFLTWPKAEDTACPHCGSHNCIGKGRSAVKTVYHIPIGANATFLTFSLQRFRCKDCGKFFTESPDWLHPSLRLSLDLYLSVCSSLQSVASIRQISEDLRIPEKTVTSVMNSVTFGRPIRLPGTLCIDEFKGDTGVWDSERSRFVTSKYHCNISDGDAGCVLDVLPQIDLAYLEQYISQFSLAERSSVKYFCTDMHGGFLSFAKKHFPGVIICVDMFHVVQMLNENINSIRRSLQNEFRDKAAFFKSRENLSLSKLYTDQYLLLKGSSRILLTAEANQRVAWNHHFDRNLKRLNEVLSLSPELKDAYDALQEFHVIIRTPQYALKRAMLSSFLDTYCHSEYPGIRHVAHTFRRNRNYIQNTWKYQRSNAVCEGLNNRIKIIKRNAYGQHSFHNFRQRILFACGSTHFIKDTCSIASVRKDYADTVPVETDSETKEEQ